MKFDYFQQKQILHYFRHLTVLVAKLWNNGPDQIVFTWGLHLLQAIDNREVLPPEISLSKIHESPYLLNNFRFDRFESQSLKEKKNSHRRHHISVVHVRMHAQKPASSASRCRLPLSFCSDGATTGWNLWAVINLASQHQQHVSPGTWAKGAVGFVCIPFWVVRNEGKTRRGRDLWEIRWMCLSCGVGMM